MDVEMGVDTTGHTPRSFYDGHGHPFSKRCEGWHGRSERRAVASPHLTFVTVPNLWWTGKWNTFAVMPADNENGVRP
jgi:hypothetical protein